MPAFDTIGDAIAARFAAAQVTPPAGLTNVRSSTADPPSALSGALPCVVVVPLAVDFRTGNGSRFGSMSWTVNFYLAERALADLARDVSALRRWLGVLVDQLRGSVQLGGLVARATIDGATIGLLTYAGNTYSGISIDVTVITTEGWSATA